MSTTPIITSFLAEDRRYRRFAFHLGVAAYACRLCAQGRLREILRRLQRGERYVEVVAGPCTVCQITRSQRECRKGASMSWNRIAVIAAIVVAAGAFLAGYVPERRLRTAAEQESTRLREQLTAAEARVRMGKLLGEALAVREVVVRQNYGQAQELSSAFFDSVRREASATPVDEFRTVLNSVLSRRDSVTAALAKADPAILDVLHTNEAQLRRALGYPVAQEPAAK